MLKNYHEDKMKKNNFFYLLHNDIKLRLGLETEYMILKTFESKLPECENNCGKTANAVALECKHITCCFDCIQKAKNCSNCKKPIDAKVKLIDIFPKN